MGGKKRFGLLAAVMLAGVIALPAAHAEEKVVRTEEVQYYDPAVGTAGVGVCFQGDSCVFVDPLPGELYASIEIVDQLGLPVYASVMQDTSGDGSWLVTDDFTVHICGATTQPIRIVAGKTVSVWVWEGPGVDPPCAGAASSGTVKVTLSNLP